MLNDFGITLPDALSDPRALSLDDAIAVYRALIEQEGYYPTLERTHPASYRVTMPFGNVKPDAIAALQSLVGNVSADASICLYADDRELGQHEQMDEKASARVVGVISIR